MDTFNTGAFAKEFDIVWQRVMANTLETSQPPSEPDLLGAMSFFIDGEFHSMQTYRILFQKSRNPKNRLLFQTLFKEEQVHLKLLQTEFFLLSGDMKKPKPPQIRIRSIPEALASVYKEELSASESYKKAVLTAPDPELRKLFSRLSEDEKRHAEKIRAFTAQLFE